MHRRSKASNINVFALFINFILKLSQYTSDLCFISKSWRTLGATSVRQSSACFTIVMSAIDSAENQGVMEIFSIHSSLHTCQDSLLVQSFFSAITLKTWVEWRLNSVKSAVLAEIPALQRISSTQERSTVRSGEPCCAGPCTLGLATSSEEMTIHASVRKYMLL